MRYRVPLLVGAACLLTGCNVFFHSGNYVREDGKWVPLQYSQASLIEPTTRPGTQQLEYEFEKQKLARVP